MYGNPIIRNVGEVKNAFDQGIKENWRQVFGSNVLLALMPIPYEHPDLDGGHKFPLNNLLMANTDYGVEQV